MAHAHETQAKISLLKKSPATHAKGFCTVGNILRVQSETFCVYSQKHSACTVRMFPTVLAGKSPQYTRKKICKCAKKCYFGMKFTQITRISRFAVVCALLFCVCGAMSAWGETFYWNSNGPDDRWANSDNWLVSPSVGTYTPTSSYPGANGSRDDNVVFGWTGAAEIPSNITINVKIKDNVKLSGFYSQFTNNASNITINFLPEDSNKPTLEFSGQFFVRLPSALAVYSNINLSFGVDIYSTSTFQNAQYVNVEITSGCTATFSSITVAANSTLDLTASNITANSIANEGTIKLQGTQQILKNDGTKSAITNRAGSTVEFYGEGVADVSKMGTTFDNLICTEPGKTLNFDSNITVRNDMELRGADGNPLTITTTNTTTPVVIKLATSQEDKGNYLDIDFEKVHIGNSPFTAITYGVSNSKKIDGTTVWGNQNGWLFPAMDNVFYWVGGNGNWNVLNNWRLGDMSTTPTNYPGNAGGTPPTTSAEVHIEPTATATVVLNTYAQIASLAINNRATLTIENNKLAINNSFTNSGNVSVGNDLTVSGAWNNSGRITIVNDTTANVNLPANFDEKGTWRYTSTRASVFDLEYNNLEIGDGATSLTVTLNRAVTAKDAITVLPNATLVAGANNITASSITIQNSAKLTTTSNTINANRIENAGTFDTAGNIINANNITNSGTINFTGATPTININDSFANNINGNINFTGVSPTINITGGTNSGTVTIDGNPNSTVNVTNSTNSTVNYTLTKADSANVNFGTTYGNLVCAPNSSNKTLNFVQDITVNGNLTLNGTSGNLLTITGNDTNITLDRANQNGSYLKINHDHVSINSTGFSPYYNVGKTSTDGNGTIPIGNMHGWLFELQDDYYWFGPSGGNWNEPANWRFSNDVSSPAPASPFYYPGNAASTPSTTGAKVHITPTAANTVVTLNTTASVYSIEMNSNATLAIGTNDLTVRNSWSNNNGTVTVTSGSATLPSGARDDGTWTYNNTADRNLVNISYNILNLYGTGTITPIAAITANHININNNNTTLALGANNLTVRNSWSNSGKVTVTSGNATLPNGATDSGTWNYNNTSNRDIIGNINYNNLNLNGPGWIIPQSNISASATIAIGSDGKLDLAGRNISAANITNDGRVRLYGTQNVGGTVANEPNSTVEYYGDTYATPININRFGSTYGNFIMRGYNKTLNVNESIAVNGDLVLQGKDVDNMLTVTRTASGTATITVNKRQASSVTANPPAGNFIAMQRRNISITGTKIGDYKGSPYYYYAENSYDLDDYNVDVLRNGWRFKPVISLENISFTLTSIGSNRFYFRTTPANMAELGNVPTKLFDMLLHRYFAVVTPKSPLAPNATLKIDAATAPQRITNGSNLAWIGLSLTNNISLQDLQNFYIRADKQTEVNQYSFHALSDFAIDVVTPRYAFDNRHLDSGNAEEAAGGVAIRNWDRDQESNGQLVTQSDITISAGQNVDGLGVPVIYFDASPDAASISTRYNSDAGGDWRIWLPQAFASLSPVANSDYITFEEGASVGGNSLRFDLPVTKGEKFSSWKAGDQISFLFELKDANGNGMTVCHEPVLNGTVLNVSATAPLYALRLQVPEDITTLDLWSFKLRDIKSQRGSITIMNNVINVLSGENMILDVNVPVSGVLNIMVMTLDGTIVKYLQHGNVSQGKHVYHWDGRNNAGKPVARGLYFIRIVGCTIDESRKVMAVWQ